MEIQEIKEKIKIINDLLKEIQIYCNKTELNFYGELEYDGKYYIKINIDKPIL